MLGMGSDLSWPKLHRLIEPQAGEIVLSSPGLKLFTQQIAGARHPGILDFGPLRRENVDHFSQWSCVLYVEDLLRTLTDDPGMSAPEEERDVEKAIERMITHKADVRFDAILAWNLFDYIDPSTIRVIMHRIGRHCRPGTILFMMSSIRETIPDDPGRFTIIDEQHLSFKSMGRDGRNGSKHSPLGLERMMPKFRLQHSFLLSGGMQDYLFSHE